METTPIVVIIIDDRITIKDISGKDSEFGILIVRGSDASIAAARHLGNIILIKVFTESRFDLKVAILITINRIPR